MSSSPYLVLLLSAVLGYLSGTVPYGLLIARAFGLGNLREIGSGNIGATNVLRTGSKPAAAATLLLDALKGTVPVIAAFSLAGLPADGAAFDKPDCGKRVIRGGAWSFPPGEARSANRWRDFPSRRSDDTGLRVVRELTEP